MLNREKDQGWVTLRRPKSLVLVPFGTVTVTTSGLGAVLMSMTASPTLPPVAPIKLLYCRGNCGKIGVFGQNQEIHVLANLCRPVKHAGLPAHEKRSGPTGLDRKRDLSDRGLDQGFLLRLARDARTRLLSRASLRLMCRKQKTAGGGPPTDELSLMG